MIFAKHFGLEGRHAFLSPSQYAWIRYSDEKLEERYIAAMAAQRGTELHQLASEAIRLGVKLQGRTTIARYVNDAIGWRMTPEQILYYSDNCFGTADTIAFRKNVLRINDLKTGVTKTSFDQLLVYFALFCLEYKMKPFEIDYELRIYQDNEVRVYDAPRNDVMNDVIHIMSQIQTFDQRINDMKMMDE